jgi:hypothetical protein
MHIKCLTCASAIALAVGASALTAGVGVAAAQPGPQPCVFGDCQGPGGPGGPPQGGPGGPGGHEQGPPPEGQGGPGGPGGPGDRGPGGPGDRGPGGPSPWDHNPGWGPPPPDQAWRGLDQGRFDHQPFNYNGSWVTPIFNPDFNNWGFWFFGIWIPL